MSDLYQRMVELPWAATIPLLVALAAGVLLWCAGRRILRKALVLVGLGIGGLLGWTVGNLLQVGLPPWAYAAVGAVVMGALAWSSYRLTVAALMAILLGLAAPAGLLAAASMGFDVGSPVTTDPASTTSSASHADRPVEGAGRLFVPPQGDTPSDRDPASGLPPELAPFIQKALGGGSDNPAATPIPPAATGAVLDAMSDRMNLSPEARERAAQVRNVAEQLWDSAAAAWQQTPPRLRPSLVGAAIVGALAGLVLGAIASGLSATVLTAGLGSGMALAAWSVLAARLGMVDGRWQPTTASAWAALWLITAMVGMSIQWITRPRRADKPA